MDIMEVTVTLSVETATKHFLVAYKQMDIVYMDVKMITGKLPSVMVSFFLL